MAALLLAVWNLQAAQVAEVKFEQEGAQKLPEAHFIATVQLCPGMEFSDEILNEDIKRLYNTGNFADVVGRTRELPDGRVEVIFQLTLRPRVREVFFRGNAKYSAEELAKQVSIAAGSLLNDRALRGSLDKLREFYREKGYTDATVTPVILPDADGKAVTLTFRIEENLKQKVHDVLFDGATVFSQWDLRHSIANQYSYLNWLPFLNDYLNRGMLNRRELDLDKARIREKYLDAGYLDFKIEEVKVTPLADDPEYVDITFKIEEGEPYHVGRQSIAGNTVFASEELLACLALAEGSVYSRAAEEVTRRAIASKYESLGYAEVSCRPVHHADFESHTVDIVYEIIEGRKFTVRNVNIVGNVQTKDKVIRRDLAIQPGDPVDRFRIDVSRQRLLGMGYFETVKATAVGTDSLNEKDVEFRVEEKPDRYHFRIGGGVSDVNSVFGMAEISTDNFDLFDPGNWFYGGGQRLRLQGIVGVDNAGFNLDFVEPWFLDLPIRFEISGYMNQVIYDRWSELRTGGRFSFSRRIFDEFTTVAVGYKFENVDVRDIDGKRMKEYMRKYDQKGNHLVSQPSVMIGRDTRDSLTDPTEGYNINLFGAVSPKMLGSSTDFYRLEAKGSYYYSFFDKAIIAMVGAKIGTVGTFKNDGDVPIFERYFLGGSDSLRGFEYRTVAPAIGKDDQIGGQTMLLLTAEVTHPIWGPLRGAAFVDVGNAWRDSYEMDFSDLNVGVGYGLRIRLPVVNAPIRLDLAYPVVNNLKYVDSKLRLHFNVGFTF